MTPIDITDWIERVDSFCADVLPDVLTRFPIYPVARRMRGASGLHSSDMCYAVAEELAQAGRWRGQGIAFSIDVEKIQERCEYIDLDAVLAQFPNIPEKRLRDLMFTERLLATSAHEICHGIVDGVAEYSGEESIKLASEVIEAVADGRRKCRGGSDGGETGVPWIDHEAQYIRVVLHMARRCNRAGRDITATQIMDPLDYGLSPMSAFAAALGDEPERLETTNILDISKTPAPDEFSAFWKADVRRWVNGYLQQTKDEVTKHGTRNL
ncbi:hypothetical protein B7486_16570 [cyanobacterium TDX16]|nr:hypothetical protein B7486_16570 [cyanobacterium TDX16]